MDVDTVLLADYASVNDTKLNVMGVFNRITAKGFPARHGVTYVVTKVSASNAEANTTKKLTIKLLDEDAANVLFTFSRDVTVVPQTGGRRYELNGILRVDGIIFPVAGTYQLSILIDDDEKRTLPLYVEQPD